MDTVYDVVVCGGGVAGVSAALASARGGAKTLLIEKGYNLGGLATLGLIVIYLPLDDGDGVKMSSGICEELIKNAYKYGPKCGKPDGWNKSAEIPKVWQDENATSIEDRKGIRYLTQYNPASFMISMEELLLENGVKILYDAHLTDVVCDDKKVKEIVISTKKGPLKLSAKAFIDATGDADLCYFAGEKTIDDNTNRRTGWYYSYNGNTVSLHQQTDPVYSEIPPTSRLYSGTDIEDISQNVIDGRKMILDHITKLNGGDFDKEYPIIIPSYHGLRVTRRLDTGFYFSENKHDRVWFNDAIGMIGNWKKDSHRYSIPYRSIKAVKNNNLFAAGRCVAASKSGSDLTRVIPTCAVTGEASGIAAAFIAKNGYEADIKTLQNELVRNGVLLNKTLFDKEE